MSTISSQKLTVLPSYAFPFIDRLSTKVQVSLAIFSSKSGVYWPTSRTGVSFPSKSSTLIEKFVGVAANPRTNWELFLEFDDSIRNSWIPLTSIKRYTNTVFSSTFSQLTLTPPRSSTRLMFSRMSKIKDLWGVTEIFIPSEISVSYTHLTLPTTLVV